MLRQKLDHEAIEQPRLFHVAGMAGAGQDLELAVANTFLQREGGRVRAVLGAGEDRGRAGDALEMVGLFGFLQRLELKANGVDVGGVVALAEQLGEVMRHRRRAKGGA